MLRPLALGSALVLGLCAAVPALAEEARYQLETVDGVILRLDQDTGQVSRCEARGENLICSAAADDLAALQDELAAANRRIAILEELNTEQREEIAALEIANRELTAAIEEGTGLPAGEGSLGDALPSEQDVEEVADWFSMVIETLRGLFDEAPAESGEGEGTGEGSL